MASVQRSTLSQLNVGEYTADFYCIVRICWCKNVQKRWSSLLRFNARQLICAWIWPLFQSYQCLFTVLYLNPTLLFCYCFQWIEPWANSTWQRSKTLWRHELPPWLSLQDQQFLRAGTSLLMNNELLGTQWPYFCMLPVPHSAFFVCLIVWTCPKALQEISTEKS